MSEMYTVISKNRFKSSQKPAKFKNYVFGCFTALCVSVVCTSVQTQGMPP